MKCRLTSLLFILILTITCFFDFGCRTNGKLTRRYFSVKDSAIDSNIKDKIQVFASVQPEPIVIPGKFIPKTIFELTDRGQTALIEAINSHERSSDSLLAKLREPLTKASHGRSKWFVDLSKFTRIFTLTSKQKVWNDQDRIAQLDIFLTINEEGLKFTGCDKIVTNYLTADLGKLTLTRTFSGEVGGSFGLNQTNSTSTELVNGSTINNTSSRGINNGSTSGNSNSGTTVNENATTTNTQGFTNSSGNTNSSTDNTSAENTSNNTNTSGSGGQTAFSSGVNGKLTGSRSFYEEVGLRQRFINLSAFIDNSKTIHFLQESISGIDVSGNAVASVSFEFTENIIQSTAIRFSKLFTSGRPAALNTIKSDHIVYSHPSLSNDITLNLGFEAVLREVDKSDRGGRTISESDDKIVRVRGKAESAGTVVISKHEFMPLLWKISGIDPSTKKETTLEIDGPENSAEQITGALYFDSYEDAANFLQWFKKSYSELATGNFKFGVQDRRYTLSISPGTLTLPIASKMEVRVLR